MILHSGATIRGLFLLNRSLHSNFAPNATRILKEFNCLNSNILDCVLRKALIRRSSTIQSFTTKFVGYESEPFEYKFGPSDVILYNLGVGASTKTQHGLDLLYEGSENFTALTSFGVIPAFGGLKTLITGQVPGLNIDLSKVLHGEQYTELLVEKFPTEATLTSTFKISAILDKGSGSVYILDIVSKDKETNEEVVKNQFSVFVVGAGGFNGPRNSDEIVETKAKPNRMPDHTTFYQTSPDQAALYRLSGDYNPLHIDPDFAKKGGFEKPILHGLCTKGIAVREVTSVFCPDDPSKVRAIKARFSKPVFPGQTIRTDMWKEGDYILFECSVEETGKPCLTGGWIKLRSLKKGIFW